MRYSHEPALSESQIGGIFIQIQAMLWIYVTPKVDRGVLQAGGQALTHCEVTEITSTSNQQAVLTTTQGSSQDKKLLLQVAHSQIISQNGQPHQSAT